LTCDPVYSRSGRERGIDFAGLFFRSCSGKATVGTSPLHASSGVSGLEGAGRFGFRRSSGRSELASRGRSDEDEEEQAGFIDIGEFMNTLDFIEKQQLRTDLPSFKPGDTIKVHVKIKEGDKERIQVFEGVCIAQKHGGARATFTVRKISFGHGVERIFPLHSKVIDKVEVVREGRVRRAKLYYIRELRGKAARIKEVKASAR